MSAALQADICSALQSANGIDAVVLFGSRARAKGAAAAADAWSDIDLHIITRQPGLFGEEVWLRSLRKQALSHYLVRPASGGVYKTTLIYRDGEVDLVVIPRAQMTLARWALRLGLDKYSRKLRVALNEMSTIMRGGYRFVRGEPAWGRFYADVVRQLPGQRLDAAGLVRLADGFVCEYIWVRQKLVRGEMIAAQRVLHRGLAEVNFQLLHEARCRRGDSSFREARRLEKILAPDELNAVTVSARLDAAELVRETDHAWATLRKLMAELLPSWKPPEDIDLLVAQATLGH